MFILRTVLLPLMPSYVLAVSKVDNIVWDEFMYKLHEFSNLMAISKSRLKRGGITRMYCYSFSKSYVVYNVPLCVYIFHRHDAVFWSQQQKCVDSKNSIYHSHVKLHMLLTINTSNIKTLVNFIFQWSTIFMHLTRVQV